MTSSSSPQVDYTWFKLNRPGSSREEKKIRQKKKKLCISDENNRISILKHQSFNLSPKKCTKTHKMKNHNKP